MTHTDEDRQDWLAGQFEAHRSRLESVAWRMLGSQAAAEDAVQEAWLRLARSDERGIDNLGGWLTTVTARVCLDQLRGRRTHREESFEARAERLGQEPGSVTTADPELEAEQADAVGLALIVVLDTLTPAERLAFVLHDMFAVPFDEVAPIVDRTPEATRQLASRARRRLRGADAVPDRQRERAVVGAFLAASRHGEFEDLLTLLDPDVVLRADPTAVTATAAARAAGLDGAPPLLDEVRGPDAVARVFAGRAQEAEPVLVGGRPALAWAPGGRPRSVFVLTVVDGLVTAVDVHADPAWIDAQDIVLAG